METNETYDSAPDTLEHIKQVKILLDQVRTELFIRGANHDKSKLGPEEKPYFDEMTPLLKNTVYGSEEAREQTKRLKPALLHHYKHNSHHPQHYSNGIDGMNLFDIIEMFCDWKASTQRGVGGDMLKSIEINRTRKKMSDQLANIFINTVPLLK